MRWLPMDAWKKCGDTFVNPLTMKNGVGGETFDEKQLEGLPCVGGLDLASRIDIAALCLIFQLAPDMYYPLMRFWVPIENALERQRKGQAPYHDWIRDGFMIGTPGNDIDYDFLRADIVQLAKRLKIKEIGFDPWNANQLTHQLNDQDGIKMIEIRQGYATLSSPSKELEALIISKKLRHSNHPVLNWMASNVCIVADPAGNIKPSRSKNRNLKIDGIVALVMGLNRLISQEWNKKSIYESRGIRTLD